MAIANRFLSMWMVFAIGIGLCWLCTSPGATQAQQSYNAVWQSSSALTSSSAFVDASALCPSPGGTVDCDSVDFCYVLAQALDKVKSTSGVSTSGVVDARGVLPYSSGNVGGPQPCNEDPFGPLGANISSTNTFPITVLLPASTIQLEMTSGPGWTLPPNVRLVGEGEYTILKASGFTSGNVIDMGESGCNPCSGISIEHVTIEGPNCSSASSNSLYGIVNNYAQQSSYVNDVGFCDIGLTGITITQTAANSGPYSNINFTAAQAGSSCITNSGVGTCPACVDIEAQTRGVRGATCIGALSKGADVSGAAAIYVNASNNTVEDVHVEGFWDGVEVGDISGTNVGNVVISNVNGATSVGYTNNVVHLCGTNHPNGSTLGTCTASGTVTDVAIVGATDVEQGGGVGTNDTTTVEDDVTGTTLNPYNNSGSGNPSSATVALYVLGESIGGGYSRFTSNPGANFTSTSGSPVSTWGVGSTAPGSSCAASATSGSVPGAVYSNTPVLCFQFANTASPRIALVALHYRMGAHPTAVPPGQPHKA